MVRALAENRVKATPQSTDVPYVMRLPDGRSVYLEIPSAWVSRDRGGEVAFRPAAVRYLDQVRAMAMRQTGTPTPGQIAALRDALGLTQQQLGTAIGVNKLTVSRWERGDLRPGRTSANALEALRRRAARRGVVLARRD